jgi:hypothetical protein
MASVSRLLLILTALISLSIAAPLTQDVSTLSSSNITFPDDDEFYRAPSGYEKAALGSILRHRPVPNPLSIDNKTPLQLKSAWQIQYRTQNSVGDPEASIVTVLVPHNARPSHLFIYAYYTVCNSTFQSKSAILTVSFYYSFHRIMGKIERILFERQVTSSTNYME